MFLCEDYFGLEEKLLAQLRQAGPLTDEEMVNYLVTCIDGDAMRLYQGMCKRRGINTFAGCMKVFDEEYDVNRESHRARVAIHRMNFDQYRRRNVYSVPCQIQRT